MQKITIFDNDQGPGNDQVNQEHTDLENALVHCDSETLRHHIRLAYALILKTIKNNPNEEIALEFSNDYETDLELFKFFADHTDLYSSNVTLMFPNIDDAEQECYLNAKNRSSTP